jgi:hypothetical protein
MISELSKRNPVTQKLPPKIFLVEIDEPLRQLNLEEQKKLAQKTALREPKELQDKGNKKR